jgi:pimeloyl-ACP methyl ester carboxylesterase
LAVDPRLHIEVHGPTADPPIVLVHGAPDRAAAFAAVIPHLGDRRVLVYDRRGYGRSLSAPAATGMADHAEDLLALAAELGSPPVVVAHSFGSNPTMLAVTLDPGAFCAVGLWEPPLPWVDWWPARTKRHNQAVAASTDAGASIETTYRQILGDEAWDALSPARQEQRRAEGVAFQVDMASELVAPFRFDDVAVPALVGYGSATAKEHVRGSAWLVEQLPEATLHPVPGAGHFANRTNPEQFASFVRATVSVARSVRWGSGRPRPAPVRKRA